MSKTVRYTRKRPPQFIRDYYDDGETAAAVYIIALLVGFIAGMFSLMLEGPILALLLFAGAFAVPASFFHIIARLIWPRKLFSTDRHYDTWERWTYLERNRMLDAEDVMYIKPLYKRMMSESYIADDDYRVFNEAYGTIRERNKLMAAPDTMRDEVEEYVNRLKSGINQMQN